MPTFARIRVRALAKINLDLRILNKRPDGYHELRTIFQTVSLADTLEIEFERGRTRIEIKSDLNISGNIIEKAAHRALEATGRTGRVGFVLQKRIPLGGGLGGGSSNAAAVLLGLPALVGKTLPLPKLIELASELGSDVPFFLLGGAALGLGRGTELYPLPEPPARPALIVCPEIHSSTAEAYAALGRKESPSPPAGIVNNFQQLVWASARGLETGGPAFENDFEEVVFRRHPQLKSIQRKLLRQGAAEARMSGSGSSIFGIFEDRALRDRAAEAFRSSQENSPRLRVYPVTMVSRSRYHALWRRQLAAFGKWTLWPPRDQYAK
ncbi:MAG TPA: 4-(cytidine 5'-diphospho)-2-C-methyl-D-erythritol kinase [Bryobacteraceae bacterium]|nr:4-(cytidine 5'-diphospho)-2-C-methyl-D-erythritol kinase [Bryobacteraceae bacterium]